MTLVAFAPAPEADNGAAQLRKALIPARLPTSENYRRYYGRAVDPNVIQTAMLNADAGLMAELTDLEDECLGNDPSASSVLVKRFGSIACLPQDLTAAKGKGIDEVLAEEIADGVRQHMAQIPHFAERLYDLAWALYYGRGAQELHWRLGGSILKWEIEELAWINARRLSFGPEREIQLVDAYNRRGNFQPEGFALRDFPHKFIWWTPRLFNVYPEREGLGPRMLYWMFFKRFSWRMRMLLTEIFGIPWRIVSSDKDANVQADALKAIADEVENLGQDNTAWIPAGAKLEIVFPDGRSGNLFEVTNNDVDRQLAKLVLGNTGTTDGEQSNRSNAIIQKSEQDIILTRDAQALSQRVQWQIVKPLVLLNWGPRALSHMPTWRLRTDPPRDTEKALKNAGLVLDMGLPVAEQQIREISGLRRPDINETQIIKTGGGGVDQFGNPLPPQVKVVDPGADPKNNVDDMKAQSGELEGGGTDEAVARAVADMLERCGVKLTPQAALMLGQMPDQLRSKAIETLILERARQLDGAQA